MAKSIEGNPGCPFVFWMFSPTDGSCCYLMPKQTLGGKKMEMRCCGNQSHAPLTSFLGFPILPPSMHRDSAQGDLSSSLLA
eukprot:6478594-Amphidinium_carterae.2